MNEYSNIGFIGLGNVGSKLAGSLLRNKFDLTVRDLMLTYGSESKLQKTDPQFNNACSIIRKTEWKNNKFDNSITNLEDRFWAQNLSSRFVIELSNLLFFHSVFLIILQALLN